MTASSYWHNIPDEFRSGGWGVACMAGIAPKQPLHPVTLRPLSTSLPTGGTDAKGREFGAWASFDTACAAAAARPGWQVGRLLWAGDGFTVLDLDNPGKGGTLDADAVAAVRKYQMQLLDEAFPQTYTEISSSGEGAHAIFRAKLEGGRRSNEVMQGGEIYGHARFMITTGNVWRDLPISDAQAQVDRMVAAVDKAGGAVAFTDDELAGLDLTPAQLQAKAMDRKRQRAKFLSLHRKGYDSPHAASACGDRSPVDMMWAHQVAHAEPSFETFVALFQQSALWRVDANGRVDKAGYHSERMYIDNYLRRTWERAVGGAVARKQHAAMLAEEGRKLVAMLKVRGNPVTGAE